MNATGAMLSQMDYGPLIDPSWMIISALLGLLALGTWLSFWRARRRGGSINASSNEIPAIVLTIAFLVWLALGKRTHMNDASVEPEDGRALIAHVPEVQKFLATDANASAIDAIQIVDSDPKSHTEEYVVGDYDKNKKALASIWQRFRVNTDTWQVTVLAGGPRQTLWIPVEEWRASGAYK